MPNSARLQSSKSLFLRQPEAASACQLSVRERWTPLTVRSECVVAATMNPDLAHDRKFERKDGQEEDW